MVFKMRSPLYQTTETKNDKPQPEPEPTPGMEPMTEDDWQHMEAQRVKKEGESTWNPVSDPLVKELKTLKPGSKKAMKIQNLINEQQGSTKVYTKKEYKDKYKKSKKPSSLKQTKKERESLESAKKEVEEVREIIDYYKKPGEVKKAGGSIWQDQRMGTGETRHTKKSESRLKKAEKKISKAEKAFVKGKTKKAKRKLSKAEKKTYKVVLDIGKAHTGRTVRTIQPKYKDDPRYK